MCLFSLVVNGSFIMSIPTSCKGWSTGVDFNEGDCLLLTSVAMAHCGQLIMC